MTESLEVPIPGETLPDRFARIVQIYGSREALASDTWRPTYGELESGSDRWAQNLGALGGEVRDRVAILMRHDLHQVTALLSSLKAGRIIVVLNPTDSIERLRMAIDDAAPSLILADASNLKLAQEIAQDSSACVCWDHVTATSARTSVCGPRIHLDSQAPAFIVYTSGSAGRPKGVMMNHQQVMHNALRLSSAMELTAVDRIALLPSLSGLHGVNNLWCTLLRGAQLLPFPVMERGVTGLADWMVNRKITAFSASTSLFRSFMKSMNRGLRIASVHVVRVGGELVTSDDFFAFQQHFSPDCTLVNTLASSEAGNITYQRYTGRDIVPEGPMAVGRAFDGIEIEIRDQDGRLVAPGGAGEIIVKSHYMSQGYWRDEALTAKRFFRDSENKPLLRSGDWGRVNTDGILEFIGRHDTRVKIRGSSVELDEVEQALSRAAGIERAVVCAFEGAYGTQLAAYVVLRGDQTLSSSTLRRAARALLPEHMVPSVFQIVDELPLMPHGKVDRHKLLQSLPPAAQHRPRTALETETEVILAAIWTEAFDIPSIGRDDNFFERGGDSLIASLIAARVYGEIGVELNLDSFTQRPTVAGLAGLIDRLRRNKCDQFRICSVPGERRLPLSFAQQRIWELSQTEKGLASYTISARYRIIGPLDVNVLRRCMNHLAKRHELLRTTFDVVPTGPVQIVHPPNEVQLTVVDLTTTPDPVIVARHLMARSASQKLDLRRGPLVHFTVIKISGTEHLLLRVAHHILYDGRSWNLYFDELAQLYEAQVSGRSLPLPETEALQYADYACWQRKFFCAEALACQNMISWWRNFLAAPPALLDWPVRRPRPAEAAPSDGYLLTGIGAATWQRMADIALQQNVTLFISWLAAFSAFLSAQTQEQDIIIGTYVSNRRLPELQNMFGDFSNPVTLRFRSELSETFRSWLMTTRDIFTLAVGHSDVPYEELRRAFERDGQNLPEIRTMFIMDTHERPIQFAGHEIALEDYAEAAIMPWGFTLLLAQQFSDCRFTFDASIYHPDTVRAVASRWRSFVETLSCHPDIPIARFANNQ
jgi:amino acid adenylation domain-containing protein